MSYIDVSKFVPVISSIANFPTFGCSCGEGFCVGDITRHLLYGDIRDRDLPFFTNTPSHLVTDVEGVTSDIVHGASGLFINYMKVVQANQVIDKAVHEYRSDTYDRDTFYGIPITEEALCPIADSMCTRALTTEQVEQSFVTAARSQFKFLPPYLSNAMSVQ